MHVECQIDTVLLRVLVLFSGNAGAKTLQHWTKQSLHNAIHVRCLDGVPQHFLNLNLTLIPTVNWKNQVFYFSHFKAWGLATVLSHCTTCLNVITSDKIVSNTCICTHQIWEWITSHCRFLQLFCLCLTKNVYFHHACNWRAAALPHSAATFYVPSFLKHLHNILQS